MVNGITYAFVCKVFIYALSRGRILPAFCFSIVLLSVVDKFDISSVFDMIQKDMQHISNILHFAVGRFILGKVWAARSLLTLPELQINPKVWFIRTDNNN